MTTIDDLVSNNRGSQTLQTDATVPSLGIIEGFYGRAWTWAERLNTATFLAQAGYKFYIYAPKADAYLRRSWAMPFPPAHQAAIANFSAQCRRIGMRFGVGFSPYNIFADFNRDAQNALALKIDALNQLGIDDLAILFDDMRGDSPNLARVQAEVATFVTRRTNATRVIVCPSYYSNDPVLDRVFGARPKNYLADLGRMLDPEIDIFWTGEEVCSREMRPGHLAEIAEQLQRKPFLWDNYPVNDGARMSAHLHLRAFTGRPASIGQLIAAHAINPALQPTLNLIPALTLIDSYRLGDNYQYGRALTRAAETVLGKPLANLLIADLLVLQDLGRERLGDKFAALRERYAAIDHPGAREIVGWLDGEYGITDEVVQTQ